MYSLLPFIFITIAISYQYFMFLCSIIFKLTFSFPFKLEELFHFKKSQLSILEVKVKYCLSLVHAFEIFFILIFNILRFYVTAFLIHLFLVKYYKAFILISCHLISFNYTCLFTFLFMSVTIVIFFLSCYQYACCSHKILF